jgi:hypothetical protein
LRQWRCFFLRSRIVLEIIARYWSEFVSSHFVLSCNGNRRPGLDRFDSRKGLGMRLWAHTGGMESMLPSGSLPPHPLNMRHVVVKNSLHAATIPFDSHARPIRFSDRALIGRRGSPANALANTECSGLFAGHLTSISKMLPENAVAKAGSQTPERKIRYQNQ